MAETAPSRDELVLALRAFAIERERFEDAIARRHAVTLSDLHALRHLILDEGLTPGGLGELMMLSSGATTALADRLERLGWLTRERHPSDRRSTVLKPTPAATQAAEEIFGPYREELADSATALSASERRACCAFLQAATSISARHAARQAGAREAEAS